MDKEKRVADKRAARNHKEDVILNRVLIWFGAAVVVELILLLLNRYYINITTAPGEIEFAGTLLKAWPAIIGVTAAGTVICLLWTVFWAKGGKRVTLPGVLFGIFFTGLVISAVTYRFYDTGVQFLCGVVPAAAVLALVYYLYQHEFFLVAVLSALGLLGVWVLPHDSGTLVKACVMLAVIVVVLAAAAVFARMLQSRQGCLTVKGRGVQLFPKNANYALLYLTCIIVAVVVILAFVLGALAFLYGVLVAWLLIMAVYYTVRMM